MSQETQAWAKQQRTGNALTKAVLTELCNWAKPTGVVEFLSIDMIADAIEVSRRTVIRHIDRLENELQLIRRVRRYRNDGGQGANGFELIGFQPSFPGTRGQAALPRVPVSPPPSDTGDTPPGDTAVTRLGNKIKPLTETIVSVCPQGQTQTASSKGKGKGSGASTRLPDDWTPPDVAELGAHVAAMVGRWPEGALERATETFRQHYRAESGPRARKADWTAAFGRWLMGADGQVLRHVKAGGTFGTGMAAATGPAPVTPHPRQADEGALATQLRDVLRRRIGAKMFDHYLDWLAFIASDGADRFTVVGDSVTAIELIEIQFGDEINAASAEVLGRKCLPTKFNVERVSNGSQGRRGSEGNGQGRASGSGQRQPASADAG